jgi:predicted small lipoprotein YifL
MILRRFAPALAVVAMLAVLAGCGDGGSDEPPPPGVPVTNQTLPPPTLSPATTLVSALPRLLRVADGWHQFEVSPQQYEVIGRNWYRVIVREKLRDQGARFGVNADPAKNFYFVLIDPGLSRLSARQILDRMLGR